MVWNSVSRRSLLKGATALAGATAASRFMGPAFAQAALETTDLELISVRDPQHSAQIALAQELGFFEEAGLNVTVNYTVNGPDLPSLAASGRVQILASALEQLASLREKGIDFKWVMKLSDISNTQGVVIGNKSGINQPADLAGKRVGMYSGAAVELAILNMCKDYDIDFASLQFVNIEPPEQAMALMRGDIDVMACWEPYVSNAAKMGGRVYFTGSQSYIEDPTTPKSVNYLYLSTGLATTGDFIEANPNTLKALIGALAKATDLIVSDPQGTVEPIARNLGIPADGLLAILQANDYSPIVDNRVIEGYPVYQDWAISRGYLKTSAPVADLLDMSLLREVLPDAVRI